MKSNTYIKDKMDELVTLFPNLKLSYFFDSGERSHYIKTLPLVDFKINTDYHKQEVLMIVDFISQFPTEEIVFISEDCLIKIDKFNYEVEGEFYAKSKLNVNSIAWSNVDNAFNLIYNGLVNDIIMNYKCLDEVNYNINKESIVEVQVVPVEIKATNNAYALAA